MSDYSDSDNSEVVDVSMQMASEPKRRVPKKNIDVSSSEEENDTDIDESIAKPINKKKTRQISSSENDSSEDDSSEDNEKQTTEDDTEECEEEEDEVQSFCPRTRFSITGIRPKDLDSSDEEDLEFDESKVFVVESSDDEELNVSNAKTTSILSNIIDSIESSADKHNFSKRLSVSFKGRKSNVFQDHVPTESMQMSFAEGQEESPLKNQVSSIITNIIESIASPIDQNNISKRLSMSSNYQQSPDDEIQIDMPNVPTESMEMSFVGNHEESPSKNQTSSNESTELHTFDAEGGPGLDDYKENSTKRQTSDIFNPNTSSPLMAQNIGVVHTPRKSLFNNSIVEKLSSTNYISESIEILSSDDEEVVVVKKPMVQPKIFHAVKRTSIKTSVSNDVIDLSLADSTKESVSRSFFQREETRLNDLLNKHKLAKILYDTKHQILPDKGVSLLRKQELLKTEIEQLKQNLASLKVDDNSINDDARSKVQRSFDVDLVNPKPEDLSWDALKKITDQEKPKYTGVKGLQTFETQKALTMDRLQNLHGSLQTMPTESQLHPDPKYLKNTTLMNHQKYGLSWMLWREQQKPRGGILADDMGLGKTLSMISLILAAKELEGDKKAEFSSDDDNTTKKWISKGRQSHCDGGTLIVCPASLIGQWKSEIEKRVKSRGLEALIHHGKNRDKNARFLTNVDVVITTYNIVSIEHKAENATAGVRWKRVILDEAHCIRNYKSQTSIAVSELKSSYRWVLTGTPIQNKELDMFALLKFLRCTPFDDLTYWKKWVDKSAGGQARLTTLMQTLMLRRTKVQLMASGHLESMPTKSIELVDVKLNKEESNVYQMVLAFSQSLFTEFLYQKHKKDYDGTMLELGKEDKKKLQATHKQFKKLHGNQEIRTHVILVLLLRLRQICCHPGLIDAMLEDSVKTEDAMDMSCVEPDLNLVEALEKMRLAGTEEADDDLNAEELETNKASSKILLRSNPVFNLQRASSKLRRCLELLDDRILHTEDKVVIVSQWSSYLDVLEHFLRQKGVRICKLTGAIPVHKRNDIVEDFNRERGGAKIMLLSLTAGGVGLNLIGANHLMLLDLHWNPQLELQAQDRIYRVGQKKPVFIHKFMCVDTVEQHIKAIQDHKLGIADSVLTGAKNVNSKLSIDDLKALFELKF